MRPIFLHLLICVAAISALSSCGGRTNGKRLDEISNPTSADSLLYYFGQIQANQYWRDAEMDSTLYSKHARESYLRGLRTAMKLIGDDESYNAGVAAGVRMATNMRQFTKDYDVELHPEVLLQSLAYGLEGDPLPGDDTNNEDFYRLLNRLRNTRDKADKAKAAVALQEAAAQLQMTPVDSNLYRKVETAGTGAPLENGMTVEAEIYLSHNGHQVIIPIPTRIQLGTTYTNSVINRALLSMTEKESSKFITTAYAIFGKHCGQHHLEPKDIISINIKLGRTFSDLPNAQSRQEPTNDEAHMVL